MKYTVESGEYKTSLDRATAGQAARDAIQLWGLKQKKPNLSSITTVTSKGKSVFLSTSVLVENALQVNNLK
jgi:hypothetical protein